MAYFLSKHLHLDNFQIMGDLRLYWEENKQKVYIYFYKCQKIILNDALKLCFSVGEKVVKILKYVNTDVIP